MTTKNRRSGQRPPSISTSGLLVGRAFPSVIGAHAGIALLAAFGGSTLLLALLKALFVVVSPSIHSATPATPLDLVSPWVRWAVAERDGVETYVVLPGTLLYFAATAALTLVLQHRRSAADLPLGFIGAIAAVAIALPTRSSEFLPLQTSWSELLLCVVAAFFMWAWHETQLRSPVLLRRIGVVAAFLIFAFAVIVSLPQPSLADYGYFIGPALKLLQGERLGTFYMQYNLLETAIFTAMVAGGLKVHVMQVLLSIVFIGWYVLYWLIARRLFQTRFIALMFMAALVTTRFLAIRDHPVMLPQVLPLRLDLWVPLLLAVMAWGLSSWRTAIAFGVVYALDSVFGFLFALVYAGALLVAWWWSHRSRANLCRSILFIAPSLASGVFQKLVFGSWISAAATHYLGVQIGFLPISPTSLFWPLLVLLGWAVAVFTFHHKEFAARMGLLVCALATVQFVYFFGRSHDHNLLNVSGVWLLVTFLAVDQAKEFGRARAVASAVLVVALMTMSAGQFTPKLERIADRLSRGVWVEPWRYEAALDSIRGRVGVNTIFVEPADAYWNYRLGIPQRGFYVPFEANVFIGDTALWMDEQMRAGMHILTTNARWIWWVQEFNDSAAMRQRGRHFEVIAAGVFFEIVAEPN